MGIYELMVTTNEVRQLANDRASSWKIMQCAAEQGMRSLRLFETDIVTPAESDAVLAFLAAMLNADPA